MSPTVALFSSPRLRNALLMVFALLPLCAAQAEPRVRPTAWAQPVIGVDLGNFYRVSDELFRSRQPDDDDMPALQVMGIKSILNLREFHDDSEHANGYALELHRVPMNAGAINDEAMEQALMIIAQAKKPLLVHCWHGSDRTGAVVALYRMVFEGWPRERAIDEFVNGGYGYHESVYSEITTYLQNVDIERFKKRVAKRN